MSPIPTRDRRPDRYAWLIAWALTLLLHAVALVGFRDLSPLHPPAPAIAKPEPVQLVFMDAPAVSRGQSAPAETRAQDAPHFFSELPADRADTPPTKPDFLSNVTSRARDRVAGGASSLPEMHGEGDAPMVRLDRSGNPSPPPSPTPSQTPRTSDPALTHSSDTSQPEAPTPADANGSGAARATPPKPHDGAAPASSDAPASSAAHPPGGAGGSEVDQPEMYNPTGNAALLGDVSLNTIAWDYAPWMMRFRMQLMQRWFAPPAYYLGILKEGGWATIQIEISRSGKLLNMQVLEEQGHPSLSQAAQAALRSMSPIEPLPADFPKPTLILRLRMIYPKFHHR